MPVEIKELIIRASIVNGDDKKSTSESGISAEEREEIISACVNQILKILERYKDR